MASLTSVLRGHAALVYICIALLCFTRATAQQLLNFGAGALPTCAEQCAFLTQAQTACVPPAAPVTNQQTYMGCFCQSAYLTALKSDASAVCGNVCQGADLTQIQSWYASTCAANTNAAANPTTTTTTAAGAQETTTATTPTTATTATQGGSTSTSTASSSSSSNGTKKNQPVQSWWAGHWKWILMLILIFVLLGLLSFLAVWLRRRHRRKRDAVAGRFNDGITTRSMTQVDGGVSGAPPGYPYNTRPRGRPTSSIVESPDGVGRGVSGSTTTLSRVREAGGEAGPGGVISTASDGSSDSRGVTPNPPGETRNPKGKLRARISEEQV
ncbi:hypothetical protein K461DRAFT_317765 [Myriangium duriaei CBS 260.36]|uniref:Integral membrane protein n=1 Tax=Myriangium duriaei CBS 260.36 TaxID=1168546 RepID=A0A9P4MK07_9PEZI|nr:hypothetical protein K461DRAFT_317765 [Myriangium duriaei CBS 260.36]